MEIDRAHGIKIANEIISTREKRLRSTGLTRTYYLNKLKALCECTKPISCIRGKEADGGTVDFVDVPDNRVQLDAVKTVIELYGDKAAEKVDVSGSQDIIVELVKYGVNDKKSVTQKIKGIELTKFNKNRKPKIPPKTPPKRKVNG